MEREKSPSLYIKTWYLDKSLIQVSIVDENATLMASEKSELSGVETTLDNMLRHLAEKGIPADRLYVPLWIPLGKAIRQTYPSADILIDFSD